MGFYITTAPPRAPKPYAGWLNRDQVLARFNWSEQHYEIAQKLLGLPKPLERGILNGSRLVDVQRWFRPDEIDAWATGFAAIAAGVWRAPAESWARRGRSWTPITDVMAAFWWTEADVAVARRCGLPIEGERGVRSADLDNWVEHVKSLPRQDAGR